MGLTITLPKVSRRLMCTISPDQIYIIKADLGMNELSRRASLAFVNMLPPDPVGDHNSWL